MPRKIDYLCCLKKHQAKMNCYGCAIKTDSFFIFVNYAKDSIYSTPHMCLECIKLFRNDDFMYETYCIVTKQFFNKMTKNLRQSIFCKEMVGKCLD